MSAVIKSINLNCACGKDKVIRQLNDLDIELGELSFMKMKSTLFDLESKVSSEDIFTLIMQRELLASSIGRVCKSSLKDFHIGIVIPPEPCSL